MAIIKRSGEREPYSEEKMKKFLSWAVGETKMSIDVLYNELTIPTKDVPVDDLLKDIEATAERLASRISTGWLYVAGRVATVALVKQHRANGLDLINPKLADFHTFIVTQLHTLSRPNPDTLWNTIPAWEPVLREAMDLEYDYSLTINNVRLLTQRQARQYKGVNETPSLVMLRQAVAGSEYSKGNYDPEHALVLLKALKATQFTNATPMAIHAGKQYRSTGSCTLLTADDSTKGIMDVASELAQHSKFGSGNGIDVSAIAGEGRYIASTEGKSSGVKPFLKIYESVLQGFNQAGKRQGAGVVTFRWWHKDFEELIYLKNTTGENDQRVRGLKYSMVTNRYLYEAAQNNEEVALICPADAKAYFGDDRLLTAWGDYFEEVYADILNQVKLGNVPGRVVTAKWIFKLYFNNAYNSGHVYEFNMDNANYQNMLNDDVHSSNLCVTGDTLLLTDRGNLPISGLVGTTVNAWNGESFSATPIFKTSHNQEVMEVSISGDIVIKATPYHRWEIMDGYHSSKIVTTADLRPEDKIVKSNVSEAVTHGTKELPLAYESGFHEGDGTYHGTDCTKIYLYTDKRSLLSKFTGYYNSSVTGTGQQERDNLYYGPNVLLGKGRVPDVSYTLESRLQWLAGYFDADGTLTDNNGAESIQAASTNVSVLHNIRNMLLEMGVDSSIRHYKDAGTSLLPMNDGSGKYREYGTKAVKRIIVAGPELMKLLDLGYSANRVQPTRRRYQRSATRFPTVMGVERTGEMQATYCGTEPVHNQLVFNGIRTMNCTEVMIPSRRTPEPSTGLCFLNSTNIAAYYSMGTEERYALIKAQVRTLDNQITTDHYPVPHTSKQYAMDNRFIGIGMSNLATLFAEQNISWDSQEALNLMDQVTEDWSFDVIMASMELAKERGPAPNWKTSKWAEGLLPSDLASQAAWELTGNYPTDSRWNWLADQIRTHGIRNLLTMAIAPTASSGAGAGLCEGIDPVTELVFNRSGDVPVTHAVNMEPQILNQYQQAFSVPNTALIKLAAVRQKWIDQGQSVSLYAKGQEFSLKEAFEERLLAHSLGLKSIYYTKFQKADADICESCS